MRKRKKKIKLKPLPKIIAISAVIICLFTYFESKVSLLPTAYLEQNAASFAQNAVNETIIKHFSDIENTYNINFNNNLELNYIEANSSEIIKIKADLNNLINESLNGNNISFIPIGNLTSYKLLNGIGFKVPVNFYYTGNAVVDLKSEIVSAGINQSKYRLVASVSASVCTASLNNNAFGEFNSEYILCEIVFTGEVPNFTANLH